MSYKHIVFSGDKPLKHNRRWGGAEKYGGLGWPMYVKQGPELPWLGLNFHLMLLQIIETPGSSV